MTASRHDRGRSARSRPVRPGIERLEDRRLLYAALGGNWLYGSRITYSFAPDGTGVGGIPSAWFGAMNARGISQAAWQQQFQKAAAAWAAVADINLVLVPDDGTAFSSAGNQQGDPRFGDIRIAGIGLPAGVLASAFYPPPSNGGTLAGDIVMNTGQPWNVNSDYDLLTVAIHEFGHSLGLGHSLISQAVMYASYTGKKQALHADDTSGIQAVYSARQPDAYEPNGTYGTAANIAPLLDGQGQLTLSGLDIANASDNDIFYVVAPPTTSGTLTVRMQSADLSTLSPKLIVLNAAHQGLGMDARPNAYGDTATVTVANVQPGQGFYIRALAANSGATGAGAYALQVNFGPYSQPPAPPPNTVVPEQPNQGGGGGALVDPRIVRGGWRSADRMLELVEIGQVAGFGETFEVGTPGDRPDRTPERVPAGPPEPFEVQAGGGLVWFHLPPVPARPEAPPARPRLHLFGATPVVDAALEELAGS